MGVPGFEPAAVPFEAEARAPDYELDVGGERIKVAVVAIGNPHVVHLVSDVDRAPVERLGPLLERHPRFPQRANVGFLQILDPATVRLRVFERGVGETQACGSGACAAVAVGRMLRRLDESVEVRLPGGQVRVRWPGEGSNVRLTGPAEMIFEGNINLE
jgi:diaminopimelate epimerase